MRLLARAHWLVMGSICLIVLLLVGCGTTPDATPGGGDVGTRKQTATTDATKMVSTISFRIDGAVRGSYTLRSSTTTSKLRHGHREFTIDIASGDRSIFLAFYGYDGPGMYKLAGHDNGGDARIDLGGTLAAWDLSMKQGSACTLNVTSQVASGQGGIDRMRGNFSCPMLTATTAQRNGQHISVSDGQFDLWIVIES